MQSRSPPFSSEDWRTTEILKGAESGPRIGEKRNVLGPPWSHLSCGKGALLGKALHTAPAFRPLSTPPRNCSTLPFPRSSAWSPGLVEKHRVFSELSAVQICLPSHSAPSKWYALASFQLNFVLVVVESFFQLPIAKIKSEHRGEPTLIAQAASQTSS